MEHIDTVANWFAARAVLIGAIAIVVYSIIPPRHLRKGRDHYWMRDQHEPKK